MTEDQKHEVFSRLLKEESPKYISQVVNVSYAAVLRLKKDLEKAKAENKLNDLMNVDRVVIEAAAADLNLPAETVGKSVERVSNGLDGLEKLDTDLQATASQINSRVRGLIMSSESPSELEVYADIICNLRNAFFGKNQVNLNVQNNVGQGDGQSRYTQFLSDVPGS